MRYFKVLDKENRSCNGGNPELKWSLPVQNADGSWAPGEWMPVVEGVLALCANGYHLTDEKHLRHWLNATIYEAEPSDEIVDGGDKIACGSVRLTRKMHWDDRIARLFACDCAERVLPIYEKTYPDDNRPRHAIEVARLYADGKVTQTELDAAGAAAGAAARYAAWYAERAAAWITAWAAAGAAAWYAAGAAAWITARAAAGYAERAAAGAAARAAAGAAERQWQTERLMWYVEGAA